MDLLVYCIEFNTREYDDLEDRYDAVITYIVSGLGTCVPATPAPSSSSDAPSLRRCGALTRSVRAASTCHPQRGFGLREPELPDLILYLNAISLIYHMF